MLQATLGFVLVACSSTPAQTSGVTKPKGVSADASRVLVVMNQRSSDSVRITSYYQEKRGIPKANIVTLQTDVADNISPNLYKSDIEAPIRKAISASKTPIDFIVLTKGVPLRLLDEGGYSVDATLAAMNLKVEPVKQKIGAFGLDEADPDAAFLRCKSPYFNAQERFTSKKFNMYLVTRLTGYTVADVYKLVDNSLKAKPAKGPILFDSQPIFKEGSGYWGMEQTMSQGETKLSAKGLEILYDRTEQFVPGNGPLMGYASWGSNDPKFDANAYHAIKFMPGAIAETFVSTSGRTFYPTQGGQSLIADLVAQGVTGVKGYVSEPYTVALCKVGILFDRYSDGYNLAESFYAATPLIKWKDIVVGDPLCKPFPSKK